MVRMRCGSCQHLNPDQAVACSRCGAFLVPPAVPSPPPGDALLGRVLAGRYVIERTLGEGGMSTVYQVHDQQLGRRAALKVLNPALSENWKARERLQREANALARIVHPNVVRVHNVLQIDGALAIELELVTGGTLASRIAAGPCAVEEAVRLVDQVLEGLAVIHAAGLIHRDLKPGNVLLTAEGVPQIADLGIARDPDAALLTAPGALLGTPDYMSPEQVRGIEVGPASDLYACGIVLFELLAARLPFATRSEKEALAAHLTEEPQWSALPETVPPALRECLRRALQKQPEQRFSTAQAMQAALRSTLAAPLAPPPAPAGLAPGTERIGEYLLRGLIGEGGMGRVYAAEERLSRRPVALKVMRAELAGSPEGRRLFVNEMAVLAQLDHPNIVRSLACAEIDGQLVMALELLPGETLRARLSGYGYARWETAVEITRQIARALDCAHSLPTPIVHRDLKPENVMLLPDGTVKVMDFGIAKVLQAVHRTATLSIGTLQYMSPEQIDAKPVDARSDLYMLGLVLYELLAGYPPFASASQRELLNLQCTAPPPPLPAHAEGVPPAVERLLFRLLEKDPAARPQSAREVVEVLAPEAIAAGPLGAGEGPVAPPAPRAPEPGAFVEPNPPPAAGPAGGPAPAPSGPRRGGPDVHPALALVIVIVFSLLAGGATLVLRVVAAQLSDVSASER